MNDTINILVKGGFTGKKLHRANNGSSVLHCGHWTKTQVTNFQVADNISTETLTKFKNEGYDLCEKCFPEFAIEKTAEVKAEIKQKASPKVHLIRMAHAHIHEGKLRFKRMQGTSCGRNGYMEMLDMSTFGKIAKETPDHCCSKCLKDYNDLRARLS